MIRSASDKKLLRDKNYFSLIFKKVLHLIFKACFQNHFTRSSKAI